AEVLAAGPYQRNSERRGYRNGSRERWISTGVGATVIELPRARLSARGEQDKEWQSVMIERYQRHARSVDSAVLVCDVSAANGGGFEGRFLRFCVACHFPRVRSRG